MIKCILKILPVLFLVFEFNSVWAFQESVNRDSQASTTPLATAENTPTSQTIMNENQILSIPFGTLFDTWLPYGRSGTAYALEDSFGLSLNSVSLPGCEPLPISYVGETPHEIKIPTNLLYSNYLLVKIDGTPKCLHRIKGFSKSAILAIRIFITFPDANRLLKSMRLEVSLFRGEELPEILKDGVDIVVLQPDGRMNKLKKRARIAQWSVFREDYKICDEGSSSGTLICATRAQLIADEELNKVYGEVRGAIESQQKKLAAESNGDAVAQILSSYVDAERSWLQFRDKECDLEESIGNEQLDIVKISCVIRLSRERIAQLRELSTQVSDNGR